MQASIAEASRFTLPRIQEAGLGWAVLLFGFVVSSLTGILFGLVPAFQASRVDLHATLKEGGRGNSQAGRTPLRSVLVAGEIAVSLMLLAGAGLMIRSFTRLGAVDSGFDPRGRADHAAGIDRIAARRAGAAQCVLSGRRWTG